ncbi:putative RNA-directed DNA polymerase from transposon X-element [Trichonephila clavipes]|nr:putative RNA-directed DNA polymerase from transposon X-element [Trichonephila clavipes]
MTQRTAPWENWHLERGFELLSTFGLVVPGWRPALQSGGLSRGYYWLLNLVQALPNWSSENHKGFSSSFLKKKYPNKEKTQNASIKTPILPYPSHDDQAIDSLNPCPDKEPVLPRPNVNKIASNSRFLILSLTNNDMSKKSPFAIHKALIGIGGEPKSVKRLRSGDLLIETNSALQTKCQRFGHSETSCRGQLTCSRCAFAGHSSTDCTLEPKCINCSQSHPSSSQLCPKWKLEKKIQEIRTNNNISYIEAKNLLPPQLPQTYAQASKPSPISVITQTDENITKIKCPPLKLLAPLSSKQRTHIPTANTTSSSAQTQLLPSISSKTSTTSDPQPPTPMSKTKGKIKEQPSQLHRPRKDSKTIDLLSIKPTPNLKKNPAKNTTLKTARDQDSPMIQLPSPKDPGDGKLLKPRMPWTQTLILRTLIAS